MTRYSPRVLATALVLAALASSARGQEAAAPEVSLRVYHTSRLDGTQDGWAALMGAQQGLYHPGSAVGEVRGPKDLAALIRGVRDSGLRIRRLVILAHGIPGGSMATGFGSPEPFAGLADAFAPDAEIVFHSCEVGAGGSGERYLVALGEALLSRNGGRILAPRWYYVGLPLLGPDGGSPAGFLQYAVRPGGGGEVTTLLPATQEAHEELGRLEEDVDFLSRVLGLGT